MTNEALTILLVEDNSAHAEIIIRLLGDYRISNHVVHVSDGEAALDYLFRRDVYADDLKFPFPHLVLLDLRLPKIDGLEVLKQLKSNQDLRLLPVVVLSSSEAQRDITAAYRQDANSYLVKPADYEQFVVLIETLGLYWLTLNRHPKL